MTSPADSGSQESTTMERKRKHSTGDAGTIRPIKHRSSQACQTCRARKVRCDVVANGSSCTNCRLDRIDCVVVPSRRGKTAQPLGNGTGQMIKPLSPRLGNAQNDSNRRLTKNGGNWKEYEAIYTPISPNGTRDVPVSVTFDEDPDKSRNDQQSAANDATNDSTNHTASPEYDGFMTPEPRYDVLNQYQSPIGKIHLPPFISPLPDRVLSEDLAFLVQKGATTIPEPDLCVEILRGYLFSVHPFMPMLEFRDFIRAVLEPREDSRISLLLFQAVMFAGLHSLQLDVIHRLGFKSVKQARKVFFARVRLLYDFDVEVDSTAVLQSCLLMSLWYGKWDDRRHTWHWTGLAYDFARSIGLHREPSPKIASEKVRRFRRRLWWSLYIRDRLISLGTRRPMRIRDDEFDVSMLTLEDFDVGPVQKLSHDQSLLPGTEESTSTALMCIQLAELCKCIGHIVASQYTVLSTQQDLPHTMLVVSKPNGGDYKELENCDNELNTWFRNLETNLRRNGSLTTHDRPRSCSEVHWSILNLTYLTAVNVLHRPQALQPLSETGEAQIIQRSRSKVRDAARSLTKVSQTMLRQDQVRFLGPIGVTAFMAACLSHMLDVNSGDEDVRDASTFRLYQSLQVLQALREIYASADASVSFLTSVIRKAGIPLPAHVIAPSTDTTAGFMTQRKPSTAHTDSTGSPRKKLGLLNAQPQGSQVNHFQDPTQSKDQYLQHQILVDSNGRPLTMDNAMPPNGVLDTVSPSAMALNPSRTGSMSTPRLTDISEPSQAARHQNTQMVGPPATGLPNPAGDGVFFDWNNRMDAGINLESMAFNYDFYSDAFGFLESHVNGVQQV